MKKWDSYKPNLLDLEQSLFFSDLVKGMHASARVVIFVSQAFHSRWSKKKDRMLVVDRPAEVLNFEQKQLLAMVVFFFCCNLSRLICIHYSQAVCKQCTF